VDNLARRRLIAKLAAIAVAASSGFVEPTRILRQIPEDDIIELVEDSDEEVPRGLLPLLARDVRARVRQRVAERTATLVSASVEEAERLVQKFSRDPSPEVRATAARGLVRVLASAPPLQRLELVSRWALSPRVGERLTIARALQNPVAVFVSDLALEELSNDDAPEVRAVAARAMAHRFAEAPDAYGRALTRLADDPEARVQRTARRLNAALAKAQKYVQAGNQRTARASARAVRTSARNSG
jgi:soluble cytochrome b562